MWRWIAIVAKVNNAYNCHRNGENIFESIWFMVYLVFVNHIDSKNESSKVAFAFLVRLVVLDTLKIIF